MDDPVPDGDTSGLVISVWNGFLLSIPFPQIPEKIDSLYFITLLLSKSFTNVVYFNWNNLFLTHSTTISTTTSETFTTPVATTTITIST